MKLNHLLELFISVHNLISKVQMKKYKLILHMEIAKQTRESTNTLSNSLNINIELLTNLIVIEMFFFILKSNQKEKKNIVYMYKTNI